MNQLFYKNIKGEYATLPEGVISQIRVGDQWVNTDDYVRFKEYIFSHQEDLLNTFQIDLEKQNDYNVTEAFLTSHKPKLITEQFLLSKGWKKIGAMIHGYDLPKTEFECEFISDEEDPRDNIFIVMSFGERVYSGAIPTESQYEVLNQLLKLHP